MGIDLNSVKENLTTSDSKTAGLDANSIKENLIGKEQDKYLAPTISATEGRSNVDVNAYKSYIPTGVFDNSGLDETRAQAQSTMAKWGAGIANTVTTGVLDVVKDASYLLDATNVTDFTKSSEEGFHNWLGDAMQAAEDKLHLPVYRTEASKGFSPLSAGWWADNLPSVASTLSMIIPAEGAIKGLGAIGELMGGDKVIKGIEGLTGVTGLADKAKGVGAAVISRHMESLMEGGQTYQDTYTQAIKGGKSEPEAKKIAGEAAAQNYKLNWAAIIQDIPEYMVLHKTFKEANSLFSKAALGEAVKTAGLEGSEEAYQFITDKESQRQALINGKVIKDDNTSLGERLLNYSKDGDLWTSAFFGALGGAGFGAYGIHKNAKEQKRFDNLLEMHKGVLLGDPDTYYRGVDGSLNKNISETIVDGNLGKFKAGLEYIKSNPERIKDADRTEIYQRLAKAEDQVNYAESISKSIMNDETLSTELKKLSFTTKLEQRSIENRLSDINNKVNTFKAKDASMGFNEDLQTYKEAKLTVEAIKNIPILADKAKELNERIPKVAEKLIERYPAFKTVKDLDEQISSSHDPELTKLLGNKALEENNLKATKEYSAKLNSPEGRKELDSNIQKRIAKDQKIKAVVDGAAKATTVKDIDALIAESDKGGVTSPELLDMLIRKKQAIAKASTKDEEDTGEDKTPEDLELEGLLNNGKDYKEETNATEVTSTLIPGNIDESKVEERNPIDDESKRPVSMEKTLNGPDDDSKEAESRAYRYYEKVVLDGHRLKVVTRKNNPTLFEKILEEDPTGKQFEKDFLEGKADKSHYVDHKITTGKHYNGVYVVLTDKNGSIISADQNGNDSTDGKMVFSTLESIGRIKSGEIKVVDENKAINELSNMRGELLNSSSKEVYLPITGKSKGIAQTLPLIEKTFFEESGEIVTKNLRQSIPVELSFGPVSQIEVELPTQQATKRKGSAILSKGNQIAFQGKLYAYDKNNTAFDLIPRNVSGTEADMIINLLGQIFHPETALVADPIKQIEKIVSTSISKDKGVNNYTFGMRGDTLYVGKDLEVTKDTFEKSIDKIKFFLNTVKYVNANVSGKYGTQLEDNFIGPTIDDSIEGTQYKTYKEYLLTGENPMFGTDLSPIGTIQYRNTYLKFSPIAESNTIEAKPILVTDSEGEVEPTTQIESKAEGDNKRGNRNLFGDTKAEDETIAPKGLDRSIDNIRTSKAKLTDFERNWFRERFPNIPIDKIVDLIENRSFGRFLSNGRILLYDKAISGTLYHEAFHVITQLYLTKDEVKALYDETRTRLSIPKASDKEVEEILAEDFAVYKENGKVLNGASKRNTTFRKIVNAIKSFLGLSTDDIKNIYNKIDKGYYTNKKIVGNRQFASLDASIAGLTVSETRDIYSGMDAYYFDIAFKNAMTPDQALNQKQDIFPLIYKRFAKKEEEAIAKGDDRLIKIFGSVLDNFNDVMTGWKERMKSLKVIVEDVSEDKLRDLAEGRENEFVEDEEEKTAEDGVRSGDQYLAAHEVSTRKGMSGASKMLIRSLKLKDKNGNEILNSLGLPQTVDFGSTYNYLLKQTAGLAEYTEIYDKIKEVAERKPEYRDLLERLGEPSDSYALDKMLFQRKFRQDFSKNLSTSFITVVESDGRVLQVDTNKQNTLERVKEKWRSNLRLNSRSVDGRLIATTPETKDNIAYLKSLGIELSPDTILNTVDNKTFTDAMTAIRNYVRETKGDVTNLFDDSKDSKIRGNINDILALEAEYNNSTIELSILSTTNKTIYPISLNNGLSNIKNLINKANSLDELYVSLPHLRSINSQGSVWLDAMFDSTTGIRIPGTKIELNLADGLRTGASIMDSVANATKDLSTGDKFVQEINHLLLYGNSSVIRTSDKGTEHIIGVNRFKNKDKLPVSIDSLAIGKNEAISGFNNIEVKKIFRSYFKSEMKRIAFFELYGVGKNIDEYSKSGGKFTIFSRFNNITGIKKAVDFRIDSLREQAKTTSEADMEVILDQFAETLNNVVDSSVNEFFTDYASELTNKLQEYGVINGIDKSLTDKYPKEQLINAVVVNDFINSVEQIKLFYGDMAFYKALFKRTSSLAGTKETCATDQFTNNWLNKDNKRKDGKNADGKVKVVIFEDSTQSKQDLGKFKKALMASDMSDSDATKTLKAYTKMDEGDAQGYITLDETREFKFRLGTWSAAFEKLWDKAQSFKKDDPSTHLSSKEIKKLYFLVAKAQYAGPSVNNKLFVPVYHKFSLLPLIPQLVEGTNMEKVLANMTRQQVGYALFKSGAKIGTPLSDEGIANRFYTEDSKVNGKDVYGTHGDVNEGDYNIQTIDYRFLGLQQKSSEPHHTVTFGTQFRKLLFSGAFVNGEEVIPGARDLYTEYNKLIRKQIKEAKEVLVKELGLDPNNLQAKDVTNLVKLLKKEAKDRALADNIIDSMQTVIREGEAVDLKYPLDSSVNKAKIDAMMMSLVNSRLVRQKANGDAYIQGASTGFETIGKRDIGTNRALKFYEQVKDKDGNIISTSKMEIMIPMSKEYYPLLDKYGSIEALNEAIAKKLEFPNNPKSKELEDSLITLVGYRIPTQGMNSIDHMIVKKFLPEQSGQLIILPTEIVAKSGGDYDIDKLNIFRPDITQEGVLADTDHNKIIDIASKMLANPANFKALVTPNSTNILTDVVEEYEYLVYTAEGGKLEFGEWESQREKGNLNYTRQLMMTEKVEEQHSKLMLAKDMIGIGAVSNVFIPLAQAVNAFINTKYFSNGKPKVVSIRFPHHLVTEGDHSFIKLSEAKDVNNENDIQEVNSQIINATVDAANSPGLLAALGMNKDTLSVYSYLNMAGVPFKYIFYMMRQPIIQRYMRESSIRKSAFVGATSDLESEREFVKDLIDEYANRLGKGEKTGYTEFSSVDLLKKYSVYEKSKDKNRASDIEFNNLQMQIMNDFLNYKKEAMLLSDAIRSVNYDTAGIGENLESIDIKLDDVAKVEMSRFVDGLDRIREHTFIGAFDQNQFTVQAYSQFYATHDPKSKTMRLNLKKLASMIGATSSEDKLRIASLINNDFINYVIQNYGYNGTSDLYNKLFKGDNSVAKRLAKIQSNPTAEDKELADNLIIQELQPLIANEKTTDLRDNVRLYTKRFDSFTANELTEAFRELKDLNPSLYKDIVDLGIIQSGLANSHITYLGIIPFEYYGDLFNKAFENFHANEGAKNMGKFNYLFIGNNSKDRLVWEMAKNLGIPAIGQQVYGKEYSFTDFTRTLEFDGKDAERAQKLREAKEKEEDLFYDQLLTNSDNKLDNSEEKTILDSDKVDIEGKPSIDLKDENNC